MSGGGGPAAREAQDQEGQRRARPDLRRHAQPQRLNLLFGQPRYSIYRWKKRLPRYSFACHKPSVFFTFILVNHNIFSNDMPDLLLFFTFILVNLEIFSIGLPDLLYPFYALFNLLLKPSPMTWLTIFSLFTSFITYYYLFT